MSQVLYDILKKTAIVLAITAGLTIFGNLISTYIPLQTWLIGPFSAIKNNNFLNAWLDMPFILSGIGFQISIIIGFWTARGTIAAIRIFDK